MTIGFTDKFRAKFPGLSDREIARVILDTPLFRAATKRQKFIERLMAKDKIGIRPTIADLAALKKSAKEIKALSRSNGQS